MIVAALSLGACANLPTPNVFPPPTVAVTSPLAADIAKANPKDAPYPSFLQVPSQPDDIRPTTAWTRNIYNTLRLRRQMRAIAVVYPQSLYGAEAFAKESKTEAVAPLSPAQAAAMTDKTNKDAKALRDRAKAPSPAN
jgi:hypothetical protein